MIERDFFMRILQEFFEAIAKLVRRHSKISDPDFSQIQEQFNEMYEQFFRIPAEHYYQMSEDKILNELENEGRSENDMFAKMQMLSELLYQDAHIKKNKQERIDLLKKSLYLLEHINSNSRTFSWDRGLRISDIKKELMEFKTSD